MSEPVRLSELTFIPEPVRNKLRRYGFGTSADFLRASTVRLAKQLGPDQVTLADVAQWQRICSALEIEGMTLPWARVLSTQRSIAARDLAHQRLGTITALFDQAQQRGDIANAPDADALAAMMVDSARIGMSGVLNATVRDAKDRALNGALVRCASVEAKSDAHGRVRLLRLPLSQPVKVTVEKAGYATLTSQVATLWGPEVIQGYRFSMKRGKSAKPASKGLSEFDGDVVPLSGGVRSVEVKNRKLRAGDVLYFFERLQGGDVKLSSYFRETQNGKTIVPVWRLPATTLPQDAPTRTNWRVTGDGLTPVTVTAFQLARLRIARRVAAEVKRAGGSKTSQVKKAIKELIKRTRALRTV